MKLINPFVADVPLFLTLENFFSFSLLFSGGIEREYYPEIGLITSIYVYLTKISFTQPPKP